MVHLSSSSLELSKENAYNRKKIMNNENNKIKKMIEQ